MDKYIKVDFIFYLIYILNNYYNINNMIDIIVHIKYTQNLVNLIDTLFYIHIQVDNLQYSLHKKCNYQLNLYNLNIIYHIFNKSNFHQSILKDIKEHKLIQIDNYLKHSLYINLYIHNIDYFLNNIMVDIQLHMNFLKLKYRNIRIHNFIG